MTSPAPNTHPGINPLLPISLLLPRGPGESIKEPSLVAQPLPIMAGKAWHLPGGFQSAGWCQGFLKE